MVVGTVTNVIRYGYTCSHPTRCACSNASHFLMIVISLYIIRVRDIGWNDNQRAGEKDDTREEEDKNV
jgi:hypothetical protein